MNGLELSDVEQQLYLGLVEKTWRTSQDFAAHASLDEATVTRSVDHLIELGLVSAESAPRAVLPQVRYAQLIADAEVDLQREQAQLAKAKRSLATLAAEHGQLGSRQSLVSLNAAELVRARLGELANSATFEVLSLHSGKALGPEAIEATKPLSRNLLRRGVDIRCVHQTSIANDRATVDYAHWMTEHGADVRTTPAVSQQLIIIDRAIALVPIDSGNLGGGALEVQHPSVVSLFLETFEQSWRKAVPLGASDRTPGELGLNRQDVVLLKLFFEGHSDQSAARVLAVSLRTVRRMVAALCEQLSIRSRFELGAKAAELGLLARVDAQPVEEAATA